MTLVHHRSPEDHAPLLERAFELEPREVAYAIDRVEGELPAFLRGTYYLNGPGRFSRGGLSYGHWLDGDGMVCALRFDGGAPTFTSRFVRSTKLRDEEEAGRPLYRTFGTAFEGDRLRRGIGLESPVNVSVYPFGGRLLAFGEQGLPWELDPRTLATRRECSFDGRLNPVSPFAAHPAFDYGTGEMFNFGVSFSPRRPCLHLYRFLAGGELAYRSRLPLEAPISLHDFGLSSGYAVFYLSPYELAVERLLDGGSTLLEALDWRPERGSRLLVADRETGEQRASVPIGSGYCLHVIDCFEVGGLLFADVIELDRPVYDQYEIPWLFPDARGAQPVRYAVDVADGRLVARTGMTFYDMCDFPAIDPRRAGTDYRDFWVLAIGDSGRPGRKFFDRLVHLDWRTGQAAWYAAPPRVYLGGEPVFVPSPGECRGGAVICQEFDAERCASAFLVFDAAEVERGPVARLPLRHPVHLGFHAAFEPPLGAVGG